MVKRKTICAIVMAAVCAAAPVLAKAGSGSVSIPAGNYGILYGAGTYVASPENCSASASVRQNTDGALLRIKVTYRGKLGSETEVNAATSSAGATSVSNPGIGIPYLDDAAPESAKFEYAVVKNGVAAYTVYLNCTGK